MRDFTLLRDSKSTRFPEKVFLPALETSLTAVLMGRDRRKEYDDALVKRTFAVFYNAFSSKDQRRSFEKSGRVEDLILIFVSKATSELAKDKALGDEHKLLVDRHVALFVRLILACLRDHGWSRDRPELTARLTTMESKLLHHDQNIADSTSDSTEEVLVPLSYDVKDMPLVKIVGKLFGLTNSQLQEDINLHKAIWTEKAALTDLKLYAYNMNLQNKKALRSDDFDTEDAYEAWKKAEQPDISQMMLAILQSNPALAKDTPGGALPQFKPSAASGSENESEDSSYSAMSRKLSDTSEHESSYVIDQPVDMSGLSLSEEPESSDDSRNSAYTYIPPRHPRSWYRSILQHALTFDLKDQSLQPSEATQDTPSLKLLSKQSMDLLNEVCVRWRIPLFTRSILFLDVIRDKFRDGEISLETLDAAFQFVSQPNIDSHKSTTPSQYQIASLTEPNLWTTADFALKQQILLSLYDALLRDLYTMLQQCYSAKRPTIGPVITVLSEYILEDPLFSKGPDDLQMYALQAEQGLKESVEEIYRELLEELLPQDEEQWEFYHAIELGKGVLTVCERTQKRYKKPIPLLKYATLLLQMVRH